MPPGPAPSAVPVVAVPAVAVPDEQPEAETEPVPDLLLPAHPVPRLQLPPLEPAPARHPGEPLTVAGFVAAELRSIPSTWIEEATGRLGTAVAVAAAPQPRPQVHPPVPARVRLVSVQPAPAIAEPLPDEPPGWPLAPAAIIRPCPLPGGATLFGPMSSAYIDGPSLLRELAGRGHSGALVTAAGGRAQAAILHQGAVLALVAAGRSGTRRLEHLSLPVAGQEQEHDLVVPVYRPEVAAALGQLVNVPARFRRMHASFIRLPDLLDHLVEGRMTGAVRVTTAGDVGVLLLSGGHLLGGYTARYPALEEPELVTRLCAGDAEIDVHASPMIGAPPSLQVERLLG